MFHTLLHPLQAFLSPLSFFLLCAFVLHPLYFARLSIIMSTFDDTNTAAHTGHDTKTAQGAAGATQQKASEAGALAQDKGVQAKEGAGNMLQQAGDAIGDAAKSVADTVNPNKSG